jgi:hypothetical protein
MEKENSFSFDFRATDRFRPGAHRLEFLAEKAVSRSLLLFVAFCLVFSPEYMIKSAPARETIDILAALALTFPFGIMLAGGAAANAWGWYAGFAVFTAAATAPVILFDSSPFILLAIPALACFIMFHLRAPHVLRAFGYLEKTSPAMEFLFFALLTGIFLLMTRQMVAASKMVNPNHFSFCRYVSLAIGCLVMFGPVFGVMFGIITRRLLDLKFLLIIPITFNSLLLFLYFLPSYIISTPSMVVALGTGAVISVVYMMAMGLPFFYCRSTRFLVLFYLVFYLCYKSWGI